MGRLRIGILMTVICPVAAISVIVPIRAQRVASARAEDPVDRAMVIAGVGKSALELRYFCVIDIVVGVTVTVAVVAVWIVAIRIITVIIRVVPVRVAPPTPERETEAIDEDDVFIMIVMMMMPIPVIPMLAVPMLTVPLAHSTTDERSRAAAHRHRRHLAATTMMTPGNNGHGSKRHCQKRTQIKQGFDIHRDFRVLRVRHRKPSEGCVRLHSSPAPLQCSMGIVSLA